MRVESLLQMLTYRRPAYSKTQRKFINRFLRPLGVKQDQYGNLWLQVGPEPATVLWSCHTDSVHHQGGRQTVRQCGEWVTADKNVLGADDAVGCWIMREMALAGKPGLYIFHQGEEIGCIGSRSIARNLPIMLQGIRYAIAFDRRGDQDVITHQCWSRCCSDDFAFALANHIGAGYRPDDGGIYTDTAEYVDIIPECTNISVGYEGEHSSRERVNVDVAEYLLDRMLELDTDSLPVVRDPAVPSKDDWSRYLRDHNDGGYMVDDKTGKVQMCEEPPRTVRDDFMSDEYVEFGEGLYRWDVKRQAFVLVRRLPYEDSTQTQDTPDMYST